MLDILSIVHFVGYLLVGLLVPVSVPIQYILLVGILWEVFEVVIARIPWTRRALETYWPIRRKYWDEHLTNKIMDLVLNVLGYKTGRFFLHTS